MNLCEQFKRERRFNEWMREFLSMIYYGGRVFKWLSVL